MRKIIVLLIVNIILFARENPFVPVVKNTTNNKIVNKEYFTSKEIKLPNDARNIKYLIFKYQSLTGEIKEYKIAINKAIDWHNPIYITTKKYKTKIVEVNLPFLNLYIKNHSVLIQTEDELLRKFLLVKPFRLVLDYKANRNFLAYEKKKINTFIKRVVLGNHKGYYRIVLYLDAKYKINLINTAEGYLIDFK